MSDDPEKKDDPAEELKQGITHLWRAARSVGLSVKKEVDRTDFGKAVDEAGREFVKAAANVVDRIAEEVNELAKPRAPGQKSEPPPPPSPVEAQAKGGADDDDEFDGVRPREKAPDASGDGIRIAVDEDPAKKKPE